MPMFLLKIVTSQLNMPMLPPIRRPIRWYYYTQEDEMHTTFVPQNCDLIKQLIVGFGFRVTGFRFPAAANNDNTRSILVTSKDPKGVQIVVSAVDPSQESSDDFHHFDAGTTTVLLVCC
jgi:hypothetical protein